MDRIRNCLAWYKYVMGRDDACDKKRAEFEDEGISWKRKAKEKMDSIRERYQCKRGVSVEEISV